MNNQSASSAREDLLIVDDKPDNLRLLSTMLRSHGYRVRTAINGQLALKGAQIAPPDLILLDINMPTMNGYQVCEQLKILAETSEIPVIFISALDQVLDKVKAFKVGGVDYITKPFQVEEVLVRVEHQLTLRSLQKKLQQQTQELQAQNLRLSTEITERQQAENALRQSEAREREKADLLEKTLEQLKRTQAQLIQTEKMSSLGRMIAGVAHELNNPISFIYGNLNFTRQYLQSLLLLLKAYQQSYPNPTPEIEEITSDIDFDFLVEDWPKLMDSMQVGAERIQEIVRSLQIFSRLNESELKPVDIHESIDHTLLILQHRLRSQGAHAAIEVTKNYGQLLPVTCYASQLNQVFMHLLNNAIDALETQPPPRVITISTSLRTENREKEGQGSNLTDTAVKTSPNPQDASNVATPAPSPIPDRQFLVIRIRDNGPGMSEDVKQRIFDPFFTTKPVGSGMGLGLSISYQIVVEKHRGQLRCVSAPKQGTEVTVEIPIAITGE